jgi:hypothetical protein
VNVSWFVSGGGPTPPFLAESLGIDESGIFHLWRSVGLPVAGYFTGTIEAERLSRLLAAASEAAAAGRLEIPPPSGAAQEQVSIDGAQADLGFRTAVEGPWGEVISELRELADDLTDYPEAAIGLQVYEGATRCRLDHLGRSPVEVNLSTLKVHARQFEGWYNPAGEWEPSTAAMVGGLVTAQPGWSIELPFEHGFSSGRVHVVHVDVDVQMTINGNLRLAGLRWAPVPDLSSDSNEHA